MNACKLLVLTLLVASLAPLGAGADPIQWEGNGHYYEYLPELVTWEQAHVVAENRTFMGRPGYLVTLTSPGENDFVYYQVLGGDAPAPEGDPWIGGYQNSSASDPYDEQWGEMYLQFSQLGAGMWNDHHSINPKPMIVEYSEDVVATEPATWGAVKSLYRR